MRYDIPPQWEQPLRTIAQATGQSVEALMEEAIALYINRHTPPEPSMSAGLSYEDIENEPDEVLWDFIESRPLAPPAPTPNLTAKSPPVDELEDEDEPYEILPGFLEP